MYRKHDIINGFKNFIRDYLIIKNFNEVVFLKDILEEYFKNDSVKVMFDVGACYGDMFSFFASNGWKIYAFEPDRENYLILKNKYGSFYNVFLDNHALFDVEKKMPFYKSNQSVGISGLFNFHSSHKYVYMVDTITLESFIINNNINCIDFLKIDAEGSDLFVLKGLCWDRIKPEVILCEFEDKKTVPLGYSFKDLSNFLYDKGYYVLVSEWYPVKEYGSKHRFNRFFVYPGDLQNFDAWGNIIAIKEKKLYEEVLNQISI